MLQREHRRPPAPAQAPPFVPAWLRAAFDPPLAVLAAPRPPRPDAGGGAAAAAARAAAAERAAAAAAVAAAAAEAPPPEYLCPISMEVV